MKLYNGDCNEVMEQMYSDGIKVDLTVTSPPYDNLRTYKDSLQWNEEIWKEVIENLYKITADGGVVVWVVGDSTVKGSESGTSFKQALYFMECGFKLHDTMIWEKPQACFGSNLCYLQAFEYMFIFSKGKIKTLNLIRDRENVFTGKRLATKTSAFNQDGSKSKTHIVESKKTGKRKNVWKIAIGQGRNGHPAIFPEQLAKDHIVSWSNENDIVFDPFTGSGTTGKMAKLLKRDFIGAEKVKEYFDISVTRIKNAVLEVKE